MAKDSKKFWDTEYKTSEHLTLSAEPSEDLQKFTRWMEREYGKGILSKHTKALDLGSGNGRNLIWLSREFGCRATGYDISTEAVEQAKKAAEGLPLTFEARSIVVPGAPEESLRRNAHSDVAPFPFPDGSQDLVLEMMTSHFLREKQRLALRDEVARVLKPGGFLFFKTFFAEEDRHAERLLKDHPADEKGSYIHPEIGVLEHVYYERELREFFEPLFEIRKFDKSHKHIGRDGGAWKRRTVSVYLEKKW